MGDEVIHDGHSITHVSNCQLRLEVHATAYLLNCAVAEVEESSAAFKFTAITPGTIPTIEGNFNGRVTVYGADELAGPWQIATEQHHFFKATLTR